MLLIVFEDSNMMRSRLTIFLHLIIFSIFLSGCTSVSQTEVTMPETSQPASALPTQEEVKYELVATQSGTLALDLIESALKVETKDYGDAGKFVTAIEGIAADSEHYWAFYVNGEYAQKGVSQTELVQGDVITFVYEAVTATK